ncbi:LysR family transcriptional regulator [Flavisphingomonas formosensis]|uniref:LysR family transcriptional regulator n=1 Tax=Flavisphingomonas formosensis TaxID=861534 RepID=UPI0012FCC602|nr:LysR family transcriptional regulator [Sphingomonas formosensis]
MELRHLRYFVRVAEELHFGRAAQRLGISQPPLSQQIRALEDELGVFLFDRTSRRVELTEAGKLFLVEARRILEQAVHAVQVARRAQHGELGELSIGFTASAPFTPAISRALFDYRQAYPEVHLTLSEMARARQIEAAVERRLDIGFLRGLELPGLPADLVTTALLVEPLLVAMRADHPLAQRREPLAISDIADERLVIYERDPGAGFNEQVEMLWRQSGHELRIAQETRELSTLLGLIAAGLGISVVSRSLSALHTDNVVYLPLADPSAISRMWLIRHRAASAACRNFVAIVERALIEAG